MQRNFDIIVGAPRSGKSYYAGQLLKQWQQNAIIVKHPSNLNDENHAFLPAKTMSNWRQGAKPGQFVKCKMAFALRKDYLAFLDWFIKEFEQKKFYGILIVDDATIYEKDRLSEQMEYIIAMRRHYALNVICIYHGFRRCPIGQFTFVNNLFVFNTTDEPGSKADVIPKYEKVEMAIQQARQNFMKTTPKEKYKPVGVNITSI